MKRVIGNGAPAFWIAYTLVIVVVGAAASVVRRLAD